MKGGMQSAAAAQLYCKCGKPTYKKIVNGGIEISIHFTRKSSYWHINDGSKIKRTFKKPELWD